MSHNAIYPGSFDPLTYGHIDLVQRGLRIFDNLIILVGSSSSKDSLFTPEEKISIIREYFADEPKIRADIGEGLTVDYARKNNINVLIRGIRATSDFEYEFQMAITNREIAPEIETIYLPTNPKYYSISSHLVKEIASMGGEVGNFVPPVVEKLMKKKIVKFKENRGKN